MEVTTVLTVVTTISIYCHAICQEKDNIIETLTWRYEKDRKQGRIEKIYNKIENKIGNRKKI